MDPLALLDQAVSALKEPFEQRDIDAGWTESSRRWAGLRVPDVLSAHLRCAGQPSDLQRRG
jgi:hypothetical protein